MVARGTGMRAPIDETTPPLSIVIATTRPWPEVRACLDSLRDQVRTARAEVIVADASGQGLPGDHDLYPEVTWLKAPGFSVFRLRALGITSARGEVVALTEDHCRVRPDWCERTLAAHKKHPMASAIGGAVENGATTHLIDWAGYFIVNGPFMLPLRSGECARISLQANISYKRRALARPLPPLGMMEMLYNQALHDRGETLVADERIVVEHVQSLGVLGTCAAHFHNGRSIAGFRLQRMPLAERALRLAGCFVLPGVMLWRTLRIVFSKRRYVGRAVLSLPFIVILLCCHAAGEFVGYLAGPGPSPERLR